MTRAGENCALLWTATPVLAPRLYRSPADTTSTVCATAEESIRVARGGKAVAAVAVAVVDAAAATILAAVAGVVVSEAAIDAAAW